MNIFLKYTKYILSNLVLYLKKCNKQPILRELLRNYENLVVSWEKIIVSWEYI